MTKAGHDLRVDEMAIVDVFTRLIFEMDTELQSMDLLILELLKASDESLLGLSRRDISEYLRAMSVDEMILMVSRIKCLFDERQELIAASSSSGGADHLYF